MSTYAEMKTSIANYLSRNDLTAEIGAAINRAIDHYEPVRFWFNEGTGTFACVASQQSYTSTDMAITDIAMIDKVQVTVNGSKYSLTPRTYNYIIDVNTSSTTLTGQPCDYAWYGDKLWLYPTPDSTYTMTLSYLNTYADLSDDSDSNDFTTYAEELIESRAMWFIQSMILKDANGSMLSKQAENDALSSLTRRTTQMLSSKTLRATSF